VTQKQLKSIAGFPEREFSFKTGQQQFEKYQAQINARLF